jgi:putative oxidoreductase
VRDLARIAPRYARLALGAAFLAAVASRLGLWGGSFDAFEAYTGEVLSFMPASTIPVLARAATVLELGFGIALVLGVGLRWATLGAAGLLLIFAVAMAISFGIREPLEYSVFSASACALLLAAEERPQPSASRSKPGTATAARTRL